MDRTIPVRCKYSELLSIDELSDFQRASKARTEQMLKRLRESIIRLGFAFPVFFWRSSAGRCWTLDGHGRLKVVAELLAEGYRFLLPDGSTTEKLPCLEVRADNRKQAYEMLLALNSRYGVFSENGLIALARNDMEFAQALQDASQIYAELPDVNTDVLLAVLRESEQTVAEAFRRRMFESAGVAVDEEESGELKNEAGDGETLSGMRLSVVNTGERVDNYPQCPVCGAKLMTVFDNGRWVLVAIASSSQDDSQEATDVNHGDEAL